MRRADFDLGLRANALLKAESVVALRYRVAEGVRTRGRWRAFVIDYTPYGPDPSRRDKRWSCVRLSVDRGVFGWDAMGRVGPPDPEDMGPTTDPRRAAAYIQRLLTEDRPKETG